MFYTALLFMALIGLPGAGAGLFYYGKGGGALFGAIGAVLGYGLLLLVMDWLPHKLEDWLETIVAAAFVIIPISALIYAAFTYITANWGVY